MNDFFAAIEFLTDHPDIEGKVGITGFCYGGGVSNAAAVAYPELGAAVPFYGRQADPADVGRIQAPLLFHFAETDENVNATWPAYRDALEAEANFSRRMFTKAPTTAFTTTRRLAMTRRRPSLPGTAPSLGSTAISEMSDATVAAAAGSGAAQAAHLQVRRPGRFS